VTRPALAVSALGLLGFGILTTACGKKGPPLAPLRIAPAAVTQLAARRMADRVVLRFGLPARNDDNSTPADVARVDVHALSVARAADAPSGPAFLDKAPVIGTIEIGPEPPAQPTLTETLTEEALRTFAPSATDSGAGRSAAPRDDGERKQASPEGADAGRPPAPEAAAPSVPVRIYAVVPVSSRGRRGPPATVSVPLVEAPPAPPAPFLTYSEEAITLRWPAVTVEGAGDEKPLYNVYQADQLPGGSPISNKPVAEAAFEDRRIEFGAERCYVVTAVRQAGAIAIESAPSPAACVTPADTFAPPAPGGLGAVAAPGAISLIWNAVEAPDVEGYIVLRGEAPNDTLQALTPKPIRETTYADAAVRPGVRYVYAVVAVDSAKNLSPQSARVEETAR
jgi:hypothetical protein